MVASGVMHVFGPSALFHYTAAVHAMLAIFTSIRTGSRPPRADEEREPFVDGIRVAHTVSQIDPLPVESDNGPGEAIRGRGETAGEKLDETVPGRRSNPPCRPVPGTTA